MLIRYAAGHVQHMQKALEQMNVKLAEVVSDITGLTGQRIIAAILEGERDPRALAALRDPKCRNDAAEIAKALEGTWRPEHLFALGQAYELYRFLHRQIAACDAAIRAELDKLPDRASGKTVATKPRRCGRKPNDLSRESRAEIHSVSVTITRRSRLWLSAPTATRSLRARRTGRFASGTSRATDPRTYWSGSCRPYGICDLCPTATTWSASPPRERSRSGTCPARSRNGPCRGSRSSVSHSAQTDRAMPRVHLPARVIRKRPPSR
jgi:hypothetical protein